MWESWQQVAGGRCSKGGSRHAGEMPGAVSVVNRRPTACLHLTGELQHFLVSLWVQVTKARDGRGVGPRFQGVVRFAVEGQTRDGE